MLFIDTEPLVSSAFAPFGDVIELGAGERKLINQGNCERFHDLARIECDGGKMGISLFQARLREMPYKLELLERHPLGSQAFLPMGGERFLIITGEDDNGKPCNIRAFISKPYQGINFHKNIWHGVLTPLSGNGLFVVFDRIGDNNLIEYPLLNPYIIKYGK